MADNVVVADGDQRIDPLQTQKELLKKITRSGAKSRTYLALDKCGPLDLPAIADVTELSINTLRARIVGEMKREGSIEETKDENGTRFFNTRAHVQVGDGTE